MIAADAVAGFEDHAAQMSVDWVAGAGHWLPEERPDLVVEEIMRLP